jgi:hypothetical protein
LNTVELEQKPQKAPITIVNIPRVSTASPTKHDLHDNHVLNRPNLPEHRERKNYSAKKELLSYDNLLETKVGPIKRVKYHKHGKDEDSCSSDDDSHPHYHAHKVQPSKLEKKVDKQLAVGDAIENSPLVITNYQAGTTKKGHEHRSHSSSSEHAKQHVRLENDRPRHPYGSRADKDGLVHTHEDSSSHQHKRYYSKPYGKHDHESSSHGDHHSHEEHGHDHKVVHSSSYLVAKTLIVGQPHHEDSSNHEAHDWNNGWLGNGKH